MKKSIISESEKYLKEGLTETTEKGLGLSNFIKAIPKALDNYFEYSTDKTAGTDVEPEVSKAEDELVAASKEFIKAFKKLDKLIKSV